MLLVASPTPMRIVMKTLRFVYVPPGGYALPDGRVLSAAQSDAAVALFARRYGYRPRTVRLTGELYRLAMVEFADATERRVAAA